MQIRNDRCAFRPFGLYGGKPGRLARNIFNPGTDDEIMTGKVTRAIHRGDVFRYEMAGAGGWGDPLERDPARVLSDVRNEYVSLDAACSEYGVEIDTRSWTVNWEKTEKRREAMRRERNQQEVPFVERGSLPAGVQPDEQS